MNAQEMNHGGRFHMDDRGIRYCDVFPDIEKGDINISIIEYCCHQFFNRIIEIIF